MSVNVVPSGLSCHWNVNVPSPAGAVAVNAAGVSPSQMVCAAEIVPAVKLLTVTLIAAVISVHGLPLSVDVTGVEPCIRCKYSCCIRFVQSPRDIVEARSVGAALPLIRECSIACGCN